MTRAVRRVARRVAGRAGAWRLLLGLDRALGRHRQVLVLMYHHISADADAGRALSILQGGTPESAFAAQLEALCRWYQPIGISEVEAIVRGEAPLAEDGFLVTFDDAYCSVRAAAGPHLRRLGVPGHVFVSTGYIDSPRRFWWTRFVDWMGRVTPAQWAEVEAAAGLDALRGALRVHEIEPWDRRRAASRALLAVLDPMGDAERDDVLGRLEEIAPSGGPSSLPLLGWDDMRAMRGEGFSFGGHTHFHPRLGRLPVDRVREELELSGSILQDRLGERPSSLAYPSGHYNAETPALVAEAGYATAFTTRPGAIYGPSARPFELPRLDLGPRIEADLDAKLAQIKCRKYSGADARRGHRRVPGLPAAPGRGPITAGAPRA